MRRGGNLDGFANAKYDEMKKENLGHARSGRGSAWTCTPRSHVVTQCGKLQPGFSFSQEEGARKSGVIHPLRRTKLRTGHAVHRRVRPDRTRVVARRALLDGDFTEPELSIHSGPLQLRVSQHHLLIRARIRQIKVFRTSDLH